MAPLVRGFRSFAFGISVPLRAATLVASQPKLLAASAAPWLLSIVLEGWLIHRLQAGLSDWIHGRLTGGWEWAALALVWLALFVGAMLAFSFIAGIAALPFNDWLAELTEPRATPPLERVGKVSLLGRARLLSIDLFKTLCAMALSVVALLLSWIPVVNLLGVTLAFLLVAFQFLSYPQTRRGQGVGDGVRFLAAHFWACLGFGMSFAFLFALPVVSSLALPLAVVGGTLLYARCHGAQKSLNAPAL